MFVRPLSIASALAAILASVGPAAAQGNTTQTSGLYILGGAGLNWLRDADTTSGGTRTTFDYGTGWTGVGALGYGFGNGLRLEFETAYRHSSLRGSNSGDVEAASVMGNALYDFSTGTAFTPYIGIGLGGARIWLDDATVAGAGVDDSSSVWAYQGLAGVAYSLDRNLKLDLGYRYFGTQDPRFTDSAGRRIDSEYGDHSVLMSLRYELGRPAH